MSTVSTAKTRKGGAESTRTGRGVIRALFANWVVVVCAVLMAIVILVAVSSPLILRDPNRQDIAHRNAPPSSAHLLGTDQLGRDLLGRLAHGARISLTVAVTATLLSVVLGVLVGTISGYAGGVVDSILMRLVDTLYAFPDFLFAVLLNAFVKGRLSGTVSGWLLPVALADRALGGMLAVFVVLGVGSWLTTCRLVRSQVLVLKETDFVEASRCAGAGGRFIIVRHILPNAVAPLIVAATLTIPSAIMLEAALSFVGLGVDPPNPSWGIMLADGVLWMRSAPQLLIFPAVAIGGTLLSFNVIGSALRDVLDPLMYRGR